MAFTNVEVSFKIFDSYSLKDKRSTVKSILARVHNRYNVSVAEVGEQDMLNVSKIGIAVANASPIVAQQIVDTIIAEIEEKYEIEIFEIHYIQ